MNEDDECEEKESKVVKRRSSLESSGEGGAGDGSCLRRHKSLDGGGQSNLQKNENEEKEKDKKDPRTERRIRNKVSSLLRYALNRCVSQTKQTFIQKLVSF